MAILKMEGTVKQRGFKSAGPLYSGPSILGPPMGPIKCGLILKMVLK